MNKQITMSTISDELATVRTKKKEFLDQIDRIVPWGEWVAMYWLTDHLWRPDSVCSASGKQRGYTHKTE